VARQTCHHARQLGHAGRGAACTQQKAI